MSAPLRSLPGAAVRRVRDALEAGGFGPQRGSSWRCPAHEDRTPSLSVDEGEGGRALVHCFAGCSAKAIASALGLETADLFDARRDSSNRERRPPSRPKQATPKRDTSKEEPAEGVRKPSKRVADYLYTDANGEPRARKVRFEPGMDGRKKSFAWEVPDDRGGWRVARKGEGNPGVLYRLPELLAALAAGDAVYLVAGEKDADRLHAAGCVATCNPEGENASAWKKAGYAEVFRDAASEEVRSCADRDAPGYGFAAAVVESLRAAGVHVRCLEALEGKDVSDHLDAGRALEELVGIDPAERLAELEHTEEELNPARAMLRERFTSAPRIAEWFDAEGLLLEPEPRRYLVEEFLPERECGLLLARGGTGKGFFELYLGVAMALGHTFGPFAVKQPRGVVIVSREDDAEELRRRFVSTIRARYPNGLTREQRRLLDENLRFIDLRGARSARLGEALVEETARKVRSMDAPGLVVLDPLGKLVPEDVVSLNGQEGACTVHEWLDVLGHETGCASLLSHHVNKASAQSGAGIGSATGSQLLEDLARFVVVLNAVEGDAARQKYMLPPDHPLGFVELTLTKRNYSPPLREPFVFERVEGGALMPRAVKSQAELRESAVLRVLVEALEDSGEGLSKEKWLAACGKKCTPKIPRGPARAAIAALEQGRGLVSKRPAQEEPGAKPRKGRAPEVYVPAEDALRRVRGELPGLEL